MQTTVVRLSHASSSSAASVIVIDQFLVLSSFTSQFFLVGDHRCLAGCQPDSSQAGLSSP
jgi:hypothetical protein